MSKVDYQALREAAEKATPGNWWIDSHGQAMVSFIDNEVLEVFVTDNKRDAVRHEDTGNLSRWRNDNDATFIAMANPATVLALLDELEAAQHGKDELQQGFIANQEEAHEAIKYATELKEQLARACTGREEAFREVDEIQKSLDHTHRRRAIWRGRAEDAEAKLEAAEKRIAELEVREVKIPELKMLRDYLAEVTHREREDILLGVKLEFHRALQAAGITTKVGE